MNISIYYRLFYLPEHYADWYAGRFNSYHNSTCGQWMVKFNSGLRDPTDFQLEQPEGKYTESALRHFLQISAHKAGQEWTYEELKNASQLDGVCAFKDLISAIRYADGADSAGRAIVAFEGVWVSNIPETSQEYSGVLVRPIKTISLKSLKEYRKES